MRYTTGSKKQRSGLFYKGTQDFASMKALQNENTLNGEQALAGQTNHPSEYSFGKRKASQVNQLYNSSGRKPSQHFRDNSQQKETSVNKMLMQSNHIKGSKPLENSLHYSALGGSKSSLWQNTMKGSPRGNTRQTSKSGLQQPTPVFGSHTLSSLPPSRKNRDDVDANYTRNTTLPVQSQLARATADFATNNTKSASQSSLNSTKMRQNYGQKDEFNRSNAKRKRSHTQKQQMPVIRPAEEFDNMRQSVSTRKMKTMTGSQVNPRIGSAHFPQARFSPNKLINSGTEISEYLVTGPSQKNLRDHQEVGDVLRDSCPDERDQFDEMNEGKEQQPSNQQDVTPAQTQYDDGFEIEFPEADENPRMQMNKDSFTNMKGSQKKLINKTDFPYSPDFIKADFEEKNRCVGVGPSEQNQFPNQKYDTGPYQDYQSMTQGVQHQEPSEQNRNIKQVMSDYQSPRGVSSNYSKGKLKKSSRNILKVRSSSSAFINGMKSNKVINKQDSKVIDDPSENFDYFYKIIIIGDEGVGKSNLLLRLTKGKYEETPKTTYGVEFEVKTLPLPGTNQRVKAQIWDTSGAKQFLQITTVHYRFAVGAFLIYDITDASTFKNCADWLRKIREFSDENVQVALIGNKADLCGGGQLTEAASKRTIFSTQNKVPAQEDRKQLFKSVIEDGEGITPRENKEAFHSNKQKNATQRIVPKMESIQYEGGEKDKNNNGKRAVVKGLAKITSPRGLGQQRAPNVGQFRAPHSPSVAMNSLTSQATYKISAASGRQSSSSRNRQRQFQHRRNTNLTSQSKQSNKYEARNGTQEAQMPIDNKESMIEEELSKKPDVTEEQNTDLKNVNNLSEARSAVIQPPQQTGPPRHLGGITSESNYQPTREVTMQEAEEFARKNDLIWLGETSLKESRNNSMSIFHALLERVHLTQVELVRQGIKPLEDLKFGEEERNVKYDRCCY